MRSKREKREEHMEYVNILLQADRLEFDTAAFRVIDVRQDRYVIPYEEIVLVYIAVCEREDNGAGEGIKGRYIPEITDITSDMTGTLVIYNRQRNCFEIRMDQVSDITAGQVIEKLTWHASHALFGSQPWLNKYDDSQYEEILEMVDIMRDCAR